MVLGRFASTHGVRGWIKVVSYTHPPENLLHYATWQVKRGHQWVEYTIEKSRLHGKFLLAKLVGCDSPETARQFTNAEIAIDREYLPDLKPNQYYWSDLIGLRVVNLSQQDLGHIDSLIDTGANDVLIVKTNSGETWVPYIPSVVKSVDLKNKTITVDWDPEF